MKEITSRLEKELIVSALGISRRAFYDKLRKYGIERDKECVSLIGKVHAGRLDQEKAGLFA